MINLYQILGLNAYACDAQIRQALAERSHTLEPRVIRAVHAWLLDPSVREQYDQKLSTQEPQMFVISQSAFNPYTPPNAYEPEPELDTRPALWNPNYASFFVLIAIPISAWLHAKNWRALGNDKLCRANQWYAVIITLLIPCLVLVETLTNIKMPYSTVAICGAGFWYFMLGRHQIAFVKEELDDDYDRKGWVKPVLGAVLYYVAFVMVIALISAVLKPSI